MNEPVPIDPSKTMPPGTAAPVGWPGVAQEVVQQGGQAYQRYQERASDRPPRPRASTLCLLTAAGLAFVTAGFSVLAVVAYLGHQSGTKDYEQRQLDRHEAVMTELRAQRTAIYGLGDAVSVHHPEAAQVGRQLERDSR